MDVREIYCCGCSRDVQARLTDGAEVYPHRADLHALPFWKCDGCGNFVGCHHKTDNPTNPLGVISTPEIKNFRMGIHRKMDEIWKSKHMTRKKVYAKMSGELGQHFHTADIRSMAEAKKVYGIVMRIRREIGLDTSQ